MKKHFIKKRFHALLLFICFLCCLTNISCAQKPRKKLLRVDRWAIVLNFSSAPENDQKIIQQASEFQLLILDPDQNHPVGLIDKKTLAIGYVSLGEAESYRSYWPEIATENWILGENPNWKENYYVDVRNPAWKKLLIERVIPGIIQKGYQGLMLDTLDTAAYLESLDPEKFKGAKESMIELVREIRNTFPHLFLLSNNGLDVSEQLAPFLDGLVVESIFWTHDQGQYKPTSAEDQAYKLQILERTRKIKFLPVFDIEYTGTDNLAGEKMCLKEATEKKFKTYFALKELNQFYTQPQADNR